VNPERPWPHIDALAATTAARGKTLRERLAIYPRYATRPDPWLAGAMRAPVAALMGDDGLPRDGATPMPVPWQVPALTLRPRTIDLAFAKAADAGLRQDAADVYGTFASDNAVTAAWQADTVPSARLEADVRQALAAAEARRGITDTQALTLFRAQGPALEALCRIADDLRADAVGPEITYVRNRNINFTNVCYVGCRFCAFAQREVDPEAYTLSLTEVADRAEEARLAGATEICVQGGIHPDLPGTFYADLIRTVKVRVPDMHIHAFSPMEVLNGATRLGISFADFLATAKEHGLGTIPGTAAEILDDDVRWLLTKGKLPADTWEEIVRTAHGLGIRSSSTIMFGHVDAPPHWVAHLRRLANIQADTGGFTEFVPLPFVPMEAPMFLKGLARRGPTFGEVLLVHAVARLALHESISNIQVSWVKLGPDGVRQALAAGVNDLGGTLMNESISRAAGSGWGQELPPEQMEAMIRSAGRIPRQRTTTYGTPPEEQVRRSFGAEPLAEPVNPPVREAGLKRPARLVRPGFAGASL
jgi:FO synthase